ncbi:unnamed protein product, partial [Staurois parvus]
MGYGGDQDTGMGYGGDQGASMAYGGDQGVGLAYGGDQDTGMVVIRTLVWGCFVCTGTGDGSPCIIYYGHCGAVFRDTWGIKLEHWGGTAECVCVLTGF